MDPISTYPSTATTTKPENGAGSVKTTAHNIADRAREAFDGVSHKVTDAASAVKERASSAAGSVKKRASAAADSSRQMVQDHPLRTLGVVLGAGVVIGILLSRSMR